MPSPTAPAIDVAGSSVAAAPTVAVAGSHTRALVADAATAAVVAPWQLLVLLMLLPLPLDRRAPLANPMLASAVCGTLSVKAYLVFLRVSGTYL